MCECAIVCVCVCVCVCVWMGGLCVHMCVFVYVGIDPINTVGEFKQSRLSSFHDNCLKPLFRDFTSQIKK